MPRNTTSLDDPEITLRLKHGIHTIFLFASPDWPFSRLTTELLSILRDRYPKGLTPSITELEATPVPANDDEEVKVVYALPKNANDLSKGWKALAAKPGDPLCGKGLTDNCCVAFTLLGTDEDEGEAEFPVELAVLDDEEDL